MNGHLVQWTCTSFEADSGILKCTLFRFLLNSSQMKTVTVNVWWRLFLNAAFSEKVGILPGFHFGSECKAQILKEVLD